MSDITIGFYGIDEAFRGQIVPSLHRFLLRKMIESVVDFNGVELLCVVLEPFAFRQVGWIKFAHPVIVIPA
jgi:hypothetical protein